MTQLRINNSQSQSLIPLQWLNYWRICQAQIPQVIILLDVTKTQFVNKSPP